MEDLNDIFKEPEDDTVKLYDENVNLENRWNLLKEKIEIERAAIRASDDDGLIRVGRFRTLNKICEIVNELEG